MSATIASLSEAQLSESTAILDDALAGDAILEVQQHLLPQLQVRQLSRKFVLYLVFKH